MYKIRKNSWKIVAKRVLLKIMYDFNNKISKHNANKILGNAE